MIPRHLAAALFAALLSLPSAAWAQDGGAMMMKKEAEGDHDHANSRHRIISVLPSTLLPSTRTLSSDDTFGWLNYTSDPIAIMFQVDVAKRLTCVSRTNFQIDGIHFAASLDSGGFASLCKLAPGTYPYEVRVGDRAPLAGTLEVEG